MDTTSSIYILFLIKSIENMQLSIENQEEIHNFIQFFNNLAW